MALMHRQDQVEFERICVTPLPQKLLAAYAEFQRAHSILRTGPMDTSLICTIAVITGSLRPVETFANPFDGIDVGTPVKVVRRSDRSIIWGGIFVGHSHHRGFEKIAFQGDRLDIREIPVDQLDLYPAGVVPEWMQAIIPPEEMPAVKVVEESYSYEIPDAVIPPLPPEAAEEAAAGTSNHPFSRVEPGTIVQVNTERHGVIKAYFRGVAEDGTVMVRTMTGPKNGRDKKYGTDLVIIERDDDDVPIVDVAGMIEAGPKTEEAAPA